MCSKFGRLGIHLTSEKQKAKSTPGAHTKFFKPRVFPLLHLSFPMFWIVGVARVPRLVRVCARIGICAAVICVLGFIVYINSVDSEPEWTLGFGSDAGLLRKEVPFIHVRLFIRGCVYVLLIRGHVLTREPVS